MADARPRDCVIDTVVLRSANAPIEHEPRSARIFRRRIRLLERIHHRELTVLISRRLLVEYERQIAVPRNDFVRHFLELVSDPSRSLLNWPRWFGAHEAARRRCRFPFHDRHLLRTALRPRGSTIFTEEASLVATDACIHREFDVHVAEPPAI